MTNTPSSAAGGAKPPFPPPPANFDPSAASPEEIAGYGLPPKPEGVAQAALRKAWDHFFQPPFTFVSADPGASVLRGDRKARHEMYLVVPELELVEQPNLPRSIPSETRIQDSANWCGASIVANGGNQFVLIFGGWTVPKVDPPPPDELGPQGQIDTYRCTTWIGLDGNRRYLDSSLPQIGTEQDLTVDTAGNETPSYFAWFQWWARTEYAVNKFQLPLTISEGLPVMAMIWVVDPYHVVAALRTYGNSNQIAIVQAASPSVSVPGGTSSTNPAISGATAEWIQERPLHNGTPSLFAKYSPVRFHHCVAGMGPAAGTLTSEQKLKAPTLLRMFDVPSDLPSRTRLTSMAKLISGTSVETRYGGFRG
jgi:hypothetical protein